MKTWTFTAGWLLKKEISRFIVWVAVLLLAGNALGKPAPANPSMDILEFLGTFETAGGKEIDPMKLEEEPVSRKASARPVSPKLKEERGNMKGKGDGNE
jgi:hypothetical protein